MKVQQAFVLIASILIIAFLQSNPVSAIHPSVFKSQASAGGTIHRLPRLYIKQASAPALSDDGRYIMYEYYSEFEGQPHFPTLRYYDTQTGTLTDLFDISYLQTYGEGAMPRLSPDGRFATFVGCYTDLPGGSGASCPHAYRYDHIAGETLMASVSTVGTPSNQPSRFPSLTADGRTVVFESKADNLVPNDTNGVSDIFIRDFATGTTTRIAITSDGGEPNGASYQPTITDNGDFIVFESDASNLVPMDTNAQCINGEAESGMTCRDIFVYEVATESLERVSVATGGGEGNGTSFSAAISNDGTRIVFTSSSNNLVADDTNGEIYLVCDYPNPPRNDCYDIFLHDRSSNETRRISLNSDGTQLNGSSQYGALSPDGSVAAFWTNAREVSPCSCWNLVRVELATNLWERITSVENTGSRMDVTPMGQQIGYTYPSQQYRTCSPNSLYCQEAAVWDATNRPYVVPLPACSDYTGPILPVPPRDKYSVYLPFVRTACREGLP